MLVGWLGFFFGIVGWWNAMLCYDRVMIMGGKEYDTFVYNITFCNVEYGAILLILF